MTKIGITEQIATLEIVIANSRGTIDNLKIAVRKKQRDKVWLDIAQDRHPKLEAVLKTLKWLKANEAQIKAALLK